MGSIYHHHIDSHISSSSSKRGVLCRARVRPVTDTAEAAATESIVAGCLQRWCGGYRRLRAETILHKCVCIALIAAVQESCSASSVSDYQSLQRLGIPPDATRNPQPPPLHWTARSKITVTRWHLCMHVLRLPVEELAWLSPLGEQIMVALYPFVGLPSALAGVGVGW